MSSLSTVDPGLFSNIILEPASKNTAPAIALGIAYCRDKLGAGNDEVLFVSPSDHVIRPDKRFIEFVRRSEENREERIYCYFRRNSGQTRNGLWIYQKRVATSHCSR